MDQIYIITNNKDKLRVAMNIFDRYHIKVKSLSTSISEIQAENSILVAKSMAMEVHKQTGLPVIREDHSFYITELNFPGPFMNYADKAIETEQLKKIISVLKDKSAYFEIAACYVESNGKSHDFIYRVPVMLLDEPRGDKKTRWEQFIIFPGGKKTFAEQKFGESDGYWSKNFEKIAKLISESQN